jgi:hypothetical protein
LTPVLRDRPFEIDDATLRPAVVEILELIRTLLMGCSESTAKRGGFGFRETLPQSPPEDLVAEISRTV